MSNEKVDTASDSKKESASSSVPATKELIVSGCYKDVFLCRERGPNGNVVTFKTTKNDGIPGSIITVKPDQEISGGMYFEISGKYVSVRYCAKDLDLRPIPMENYGKWSPKDEVYGTDGEPMPDWFKPMIKKGKRTILVFEPSTPFKDPFGMTKAFQDLMTLENFEMKPSQTPGSLLGSRENNPLSEVNDLIKIGNVKDARKILMDLLAIDLRCLDAHALLGEIEFENDNVQKALLHYQMGASIGELSLENQDPNPLVPWNYLENRPFLRCFYGTGICAWKSKNFSLAREIFLKLLWYNPRDNQSIRFILDYVKKRKSWDYFKQHQILKGNRFEGTMLYHVFTFLQT